MTQYSKAKTNALDNIKYMAQSIYGLLPKDCNFVTKTIELTYVSSGTASVLETLVNPMYVTNIQVAKSLSKISNKVYVAISADDEVNNNFVDLGTDGDMLTGNIWKYIKVSGDASNGDIITLTLTGYELNYTEYN